MDVKDSIIEGDAVTLLKNLEVRGSSQTLKRGPLGLKTKFLKKT